MTPASSDLDELDELLADQSDECMLLSQLDGFLAGVAVSPEAIPPSQWLKQVWCGEDGEGEPSFADMDGFQRFLDLIMRHYNAVLAALATPGGYEPVLEEDTRNGDVLWEMWIDGFARAMDLAPGGWRRISMGDDAGAQAAVAGIRQLSEFADGKKQLTREEEDQWDREAPDLIPIWVEMLHSWRLEHDPLRPIPAGGKKVGRNEACPCGSGKKYKKCCGLN